MRTNIISLFLAKKVNLIRILILILCLYPKISMSIDLSLWSDDCFAIWAVKDGVAGESSAKVTHSDWVLCNRANWGKPGVKVIINKAASAGVNEIWWRSHGGGICEYPSQLAESTYRIDPALGVDYSSWDPFTIAIEQAHRLGMKIYVWVTPLEESHRYEHWCRSRYTDLHRDTWGVDKNGNITPMPSFFYEKYRNYKIAIIDELIHRWNFDGIVLAFNLMGAPTPMPEWGYIPELMAAFQAQTGRNPMTIPVNDSEWIAFRASYVGKYVDAVKDRVEEVNKTRPFKLIMGSMFYREFNPRINIPLWIQDRCDGLFMASFSQQNGWGHIETDITRPFRNISNVPVPKIFGAYVVNGDSETILDVGQQVIAAGMRINWIETSGLRYGVAGTLAFEPNVVLNRSKTFTSSVKTISARVLGYCQWELRANGLLLGSGDTYGREYNLEPTGIASSTTVDFSFTASRFSQENHTGIAAEIIIKCEDDSEHILVTDNLWQLNGNGHLRKVGEPGAIPFINLN